MISLNSSLFLIACLIISLSFFLYGLIYHSRHPADPLGMNIDRIRKEVASETLTLDISYRRVAYLVFVWWDFLFVGF